MSISSSIFVVSIGDALLQKTYTFSILDKKRAANNGEMPKYYVEGNHEAIISKDVFMRVQSEIARRANLNPDASAESTAASTHFPAWCSADTAEASTAG